MNKIDFLDPEIQNHASGSQSYIGSGSGQEGSEFFVLHVLVNSFD